MVCAIEFLKKTSKMITSKVPIILLLGINIVVGQNFWNKYQERSVPYFNEQDEWYSSLHDMPRLHNFGTVGIPLQRPGVPYEARSSYNRGLGRFTVPYQSSNLRSWMKPYDTRMGTMKDILMDYYQPNTRIVS